MTKASFKLIEQQLGDTNQSISLVRFGKIGEHSVRISVKSDSYRQQCYAHLDVLDKQKMEWNTISSIKPTEMSTPEGLKSYPGAYGVNRDLTKFVRYFEADVKRLINLFVALV